MRARARSKETQFPQTRSCQRSLRATLRSSSKQNPSANATTWSQVSARGGVLDMRRATKNVAGDRMMPVAGQGLCGCVLLHGACLCCMDVLDSTAVCAGCEQVDLELMNWTIGLWTHCVATAQLLYRSWVRVVVVAGLFPMLFCFSLVNLVRFCRPSSGSTCAAGTWRGRCSGSAWACACASVISCCCSWQEQEQVRTLLLLCTATTPTGP